MNDITYHDIRYVDYFIIPLFPSVIFIFIWSSDLWMMRFLYLWIMFLFAAISHFVF